MNREKFKFRFFIQVLLLICVALGLQGGCMEHDQHGYPYSVKFPKSGGKKIVNGNTSLGYIKIYDQKTGGGDSDMYFPSHEDEENEELFVKYEWLTVIHDVDTHQITLIAEPNNTKKKRKLRIESDDGKSYLEINVTQSK
ncbi:MAG: hypothetical protein K2K82_09340 [Muribaculaceae bacterium]|nr:hypothetical protein [Muribaculaceae bacterium]